MTTERLSSAELCGSPDDVQASQRLPLAEDLAADAACAVTGDDVSVPRALAWSWLLPSGSVTQADGPLPWLSPAAVPDRGRTTSQVLVAWRRWHQSPRLADAVGVVAVDFSSRQSAVLENAGLRHLRRFAVLPHPAAPRWFIPLDSPRISAAAFQLTQPTRPWLQAIHRVARATVRTGLPVWYRHQLCVATRQRAPLEQHLQDVLGLDWMRVAFTSGNAETVRNRKRTLVALDRQGVIRGYAKIPASAVGGQRLQSEADAIRNLHRLHPEIAAPRVLCDRAVDDQPMLITSVLPGRPPGPALTAAHRRLLDRLQRGAPRPATSSSGLRRLAARLGSLPTGDAHEGSFPPGADMPPEMPCGAPLLAGIWPELEAMVVPATFQHGDFAPWNLRQQGDCLAAFDWEYAEPDGLPLLDECHHRMSVEFFLRSRSLPRVAQEFAAMAHSATLNLSVRQIRLLQVVYLLDHLCRLAEEGYPADYPKRLWWQQALTDVLRAMRCEERP